MAARADHLEKLIRPELDEGAWVVCDRFADSTLAYQGVSRGLGLKTVRKLQVIVLEAFKPDLTFVLDMPAEGGLLRAHARGSGHGMRFERFGTEFHEKLRTAFRNIAAQEPERCVMINADRASDAVAADVWRIVQERLAP
jgi:dTMP kinase